MHICSSDSSTVLPAPVLQAMPPLVASMSVLTPPHLYSGSTPPRMPSTASVCLTEWLPLLPQVSTSGPSGKPPLHFQPQETIVHASASSPLLCIPFTTLIPLYSRAFVYVPGPKWTVSYFKQRWHPLFFLSQRRGHSTNKSLTSIQRGTYIKPPTTLRKVAHVSER